MILLAKKMIHSQRMTSGDAIHTDENNQVIGTSHKGLFGKEIIIDSNGRFAGIKRKGLLGEEQYYDQNGHLVASTHDSILGTKTAVSPDGKDLGTGHPGLGSEKITILEDEAEEHPEEHSGGAWGLLFFSIFIVIAVLMFVLR